MSKIGFISPSGWFNSTPSDFLSIAPEGTEVAGAFIPSEHLGGTMETFTLETVAASVGAMDEAACGFATAGADMVTQYGSPFSLVHGLEARPIQQRISESCGLPVVLMGVAMLDALDALGVKRVAVASGYFTQKPWAQMVHSALTLHGFNVVYQKDWIQQCIVGNQELSDKLAWVQDDEYAKKAVRETASRCQGNADAIIVFGGGIRLFNIVAELENESGLPIIGGDIAMFWATLRTLKQQPKPGNHGILLNSLQ